MLVESYQCSHHQSRIIVWTLHLECLWGRLSLCDTQRIPVLLEAKRVGGDGGLVARSCPTLVTLWSVACRAPLSMDFLGKTIGVIAISFSRGSSWPRDWTCVSCIGRQILYHWAAREAPGVGADRISSGWCIGESGCADDGDPLRVAEMVVSASCRCGKPRHTHSLAMILIFIVTYLFGSAGS